MSSIIQKLLRYRKELHKWRDAGKPMRTAEEIKNIHEICSSCAYFRKDGGFGANMDQCGKCGCNLSPINTTRMNKIALGTTECPLDKPKWGPNLPPEPPK